MEAPGRGLPCRFRSFGRWISCTRRTSGLGRCRVRAPQMGRAWPAPHLARARQVVDAPPAGLAQPGAPAREERGARRLHAVVRRFACPPGTSDGDQLLPGSTGDDQESSLDRERPPEGFRGTARPRDATIVTPGLAALTGASPAIP